MRLYKTFDRNPSTSRKPVWTASADAASKAKTAMVAALKEFEQPHRDVAYEPVEIDTRKEGLVTFLNGL